MTQWLPAALRRRTGNSHSGSQPVDTVGRTSLSPAGSAPSATEIKVNIVTLTEASEQQIPQRPSKATKSTIELLAPLPLEAPDHPRAKPEIMMEASAYQAVSFGKLIAAGIVAVPPDQDEEYIVVNKRFFVDALHFYIRSIAFDESFYISAYPDVRDAVRLGVLKSARDHYIRHGYFEHRFPYDIRVDANWYLAAHPDVADAVSANTYASAQAHFEMTGYREGRLPYAGFSLTQPAAGQ